MTISAECSDCGSVFRVSDEHAGRGFRCKSCGAKCRVPEASRSKSEKAKPSQRSRRPATSAPRKRSTKASPPADEWDQFDYSYGEDDAYEDYDQHEDYEGHSPSKRRSARSRRSGKNKAGRSSGLSAVRESAVRIFKWVGFILVFLVLLMVMSGVAFSIAKSAPEKAAQVGSLLLMAGFVCGIVGGIGLIVMAFKEDVVAGLISLFVPLYAFIWATSRWEETRTWLVISSLGTLMFFFGGALLSGGGPPHR